jgi:dTDP-4-amino-4,6-dideoxygalactose transaminase
MDFNTVTDFENKIAEFFGSPYAVMTDSCTHSLELSLIYTKTKQITCPIRTYLSVAFLANKLNLGLKWNNEKWENYYYLTDRVIDAAVLWKKNSYIQNTLMCLSFQYQKHLSLGRGGVILCPDRKHWLDLKKMSYDGRLPNIPWREQNISTVGYHYYATPELAQLGLDKLDEAIRTIPRQWNYTDWPDISKMNVFNNI